MLALLTMNSVRNYQWPGYPMWGHQIFVYDHSADRAPITMTRLVVLVAKTVEAFFEVSDLHFQLARPLKASRYTARTSWEDWLDRMQARSVGLKWQDRSVCSIRVATSLHWKLAAGVVHASVARIPL